MNNGAIQNDFAMLEQRAWANYDEAKTLYHLSGFREKDDHGALARSILTQGLKAGSTVATESGLIPAIWFFVDKKAAGAIAESLLMQDYQLFSIRKNAIPRHTIHWDNASDSWILHGFYTLREHVPPSYIRYVGTFKVLYPEHPNWRHIDADTGSEIT